MMMIFESGCKFDSGYCVNKVLTPLFESLDDRRGETFGKVMIDTGHGRSREARISQQFLVQKGMRTVIHLSPWVDIAPSAFYLSGYVETLLRGELFETDETFSSEVEVIMGTLEKSTLYRVFLEWMTRLEQYIETNVDHVGRPRIHILLMISFQRWIAK
jgi:hypothetical protein